jgi:hypothetical protein
MFIIFPSSRQNVRISKPSLNKRIGIYWDILCSWWQLRWHCPFFNPSNVLWYSLRSHHPPFFHAPQRPGFPYHWYRAGWYRLETTHSLASSFVVTFAFFWRMSRIDINRSARKGESYLLFWKMTMDVIFHSVVCINTLLDCPLRRRWCWTEKWSYSSRWAWMVISHGKMATPIGC